MKKSIIIFLSVLAMSITFSGCGSEGSTSVSGGNSASNAANPTGDVDTENADDGTTEGEVNVLIASKTSLEDLFGAVPANPGN